MADRRVLTDEEIDQDIRHQLVPLYPPNMPTEAMTHYEQATFRRMRAEYRRIEALVLERIGGCLHPDCDNRPSYCSAHSLSEREALNSGDGTEKA